MIDKEVFNILKGLLPYTDKPVPLHESLFAGNEWKYVKECLDTGWVSSKGRFVDRFESMIADYTGHKWAVAVVNGTCALHVALRLSGISPGDEVLVPALTFVATANSVTYCGAEPHFVDIEEETLGLDPSKLMDYLSEIAEIRPEGSFNRATGARIRAVIPMHTFGHPIDLDPLLDVCKRFHLVMIEDGAEALGSLYKERHIGHWGTSAILSFNGNKTITTGGGGAILTNDKALAERAKHITTTAKVRNKRAFYHDEIGYNYRLPNINAALGCAQMERLADFIEKKRAAAKLYSEAFSQLKGVKFFREPEFARSNYWLNVLLLDADIADHRDSIIELTRVNGIMTRPAWVLMHKLPMFVDCPRMDLKKAEDLGKRIINIPSSVNLFNKLEAAKKGHGDLL